MGENLPDSNSTSTRSPGLRWQYFVLGLGLLMIMGAGLFFLFRRSPAAPTPEVDLVDFEATEIYVEAVVGQPQHVNPLLAKSQVDRDLVALIYSGLTRLDEYGQPIPDLAEGWTVSSDGLTYTFTLRDDITWHDGESFTAEDVAFTMSLLRDPDFSGLDSLAAFWRTVETYVVDKNTVRFILTQPLAAFPEYAGIGLLPAHLLASVEPGELAEDPFNLAPIGTGRLRWEMAEQAGDDELARVRLEPFEAYYDQQRSVALEALVLSFHDTATAAFQTLGEAQAMGNLSSEQLEAVLDSQSFQVYTSYYPSYSAIILNQRDEERLPFFQDREVRNALFMALDRETIINEVRSRTAIVANSPLTPGTWAFTSVQPLPYDPEQARTLLNEAGWTTDGETWTQGDTSLTFTLLVSDTPTSRTIGERAAAQWQAIGIDVQLEVLEPDELIAELQAAEDGTPSFDAALVEFGQGFLADPDPYPFWHESQIEEGQNLSGFADRDVSEALEIARKDPNGVRRAELYATFQQMFMDRTAAVLMYRPLYHYAVSCQVTGVQLKLYVDASERFRNLHEWEIASLEESRDLCPDN